MCLRMCHTGWWWRRRRGVWFREQALSLFIIIDHRMCDIERFKHFFWCIVSTGKDSPAGIGNGGRRHKETALVPKQGSRRRCLFFFFLFVFRWRHGTAASRRSIGRRRRTRIRLTGTGRCRRTSVRSLTGLGFHHHTSGCKSHYHHHQEPHNNDKRRPALCCCKYGHFCFG